MSGQGAPRAKRLTIEERLVESLDWIALRTLLDARLVELLAAEMSEPADPQAIANLERLRLRVAEWRPGTVPAARPLGAGAGLHHDQIKASPEAWAECEYLGTQRRADGTGLELRNCHCGSTLAKPVP